MTKSRELHGNDQGVRSSEHGVSVALGVWGTLRWTKFCIWALVRPKSGYPSWVFPGSLTRNLANHTYLKQPEWDQIATWASRGAGLFTDEILQTVRDPTSLSAQR